MPRNVAHRIKELEGKIVAVCMTCGHSHFVAGRFECDRKRSHCHSSRVRRQLAEIKRLEEGDERDSARKSSENS